MFVNRTGRWQSWAERLAERYGRIRTHGMPAAMRLRQPVASTVHDHRRWINHLWQLSPRVNLAISAGTRQINQTIASTPPRINLAIAPIISAMRTQNTFLQQHEYRTEVQQQILKRESATKLEVLHRQASVTAGVNQITTAVRRLFFDQSTSSVVLRQTMTEACREILHRVLRNLRTEDTTLVARTITLQKPAGAMTIAPAANAATIQKANAGQDLISISQTRAESQRLPSIDHLTNEVIRQLDRKMIAHRERMGTVF
jgi:hypothetical protein